MRKIVIRIGGHLLFSSRNKINVNLINEFSKILKKACDEGNIIRLVIGGGDYAREYISAAANINASEFEKDYLAILITRANAFLFKLALKEYAYDYIPQTLDEILKINSLTNKIIVCGGLTPAQSTTSVAAIIAEAIKADLIINATNVEGVYSKDPKVYHDAKLLKKVSTQELRSILKDQQTKAGYYELIDQQAINIIERAKIPLRVINGEKAENIIKVIKGEDIGTLVVPESNCS